jgi:quercetin dioxygenase-like cupin family protein
MTRGHATSGTAVREARPLSGQGLTYHLADEIRQLRDDLELRTAGRTAKTLAKSGNLRLTLILLSAGSTLEPEAAAGGASLHVLEGHLQVQADGQTLDLRPGELVVLSENLREPAQAVDDCAFLVTVAWPQGAGAWDQEAKTGHLD